MSYDYLVYGVGAEVQTFNIPGVQQHACFMKELGDAEQVRALPSFIVYLSDEGVFGIDEPRVHGL